MRLLKLFPQCRRIGLPRKTCILIAGAVVVVVILIYQRIMFNTNARPRASGAGKVNLETKQVLVWTKFFRQNHWVRNDHFLGCAVDRCSVTEDKDYLLQSDAVLFHERDIKVDGVALLPSDRAQNQRWIWLTQETVMNFEINVREYKNLFNWTMTYRSDSDVVIPYGAVVKKSHPRTKLELEKSVAEEAQKRTKLVAIRISNCASPYTDRMKYVHKLQEYIPVTVLGKCGESCDLHDNCNDKYMSQFKFYLSFENSHCKDYITEKLWLPLQFWHNVPVVMGGASPEDYEAVAPPHSYIHVESFKSPKHLADYLILLSRNDSLYNDYFTWRRTHEYTFPGYCDLCAALHDQSLPAKTADLVKFYSTDKCADDHPHYV